MTVNFYKNSSPVNYVMKTIALTDELDCELKENCSISNPIIEVLGTNGLNANYMYIPLFSRYYYFTDITTTQYNTLIITGHVDVLMSFQSSLLSAQGIVARNENMWNGYLNDRYLHTLAYPRIQTKKFDTKLNGNAQYYLITSGEKVGD